MPLALRSCAASMATLIAFGRRGEPLFAALAGASLRFVIFAGLRWLVVFAMQSIVQSKDDAPRCSGRRNQARHRRGCGRRARGAGCRLMKCPEWVRRPESRVCALMNDQRPMGRGHVMSLT